jgi:Transposase DDE domain
MKDYNGIEITEEFYEFFAPYFVNLISHISDPREADNINLNYTLSSYLSTMILGICQGATTMRQIILFSQDQSVREQIAFLFGGGDTARSQNAFTRLSRQLNPQEFQQQYQVIFHDLHDTHALDPFMINNLMIGAIDGIELHNHLYTDLQNVTPCSHCLKRVHKKGTEHEREECFHRHVVMSLVGHPGSLFMAQEPMYPSEDGHDKGSEKKAAKRLLKRLSAHGFLDLLDVVVCDALYADADFLRSAAAYGVIPVIRIKQENYNIMKEVNDLGEHVPFSPEAYDAERKRHYQYRVFEYLTSWTSYQGELCIVEIYERLPNGVVQKSRWVFPQEYAVKLLPPLVREVGHLRWQEEINEFKLANQHFDIKHILHHEPNAIELFLFLKFFVLTFISLFLSQREAHLQKKTVLPRTFST